MRVARITMVAERNFEEERRLREEGRRRAFYLFQGAILYIAIFFAVTGVVCFLQQEFVANLCPKEKWQPMPAPTTTIELPAGEVIFGPEGSATSDEGSEYEDDEDFKWYPQLKNM